MPKNKALWRSTVIITITLLSILSGYIFQCIWDSMDRSNYPIKYEDYVEVYAYEYGVPEYVVYSIIKVESDFDSGAVSESGAIGLMQMMPSTFVWLTSENSENLDSGMLYDPKTNIKYGCYYLSKLFLQFGTWDEVYAAYNAGPTVVSEWLSDTSISKDGKSLDSIPYEETREYVEKVKKANEIYKKLYYED